MTFFGRLCHPSRLNGDLSVSCSGCNKLGGEVRAQVVIQRMGDWFIVGLGLGNATRLIPFIQLTEEWIGAFNRLPVLVSLQLGVDLDAVNARINHFARFQLVLGPENN